MSRPLRSFDVSHLHCVADVLEVLGTELQDLQSIAAETDFSKPDQADQFVRNVAFLKSYYERAEVLIRESFVQTDQPAGRAVDCCTAR